MLIVSVGVSLAVAVFRRLLPQRHKWWFWLLPVIIAIAAFAVDFFVRTDAEQVRDVIYKAVRAVEREDVEAMEPLISEDYHDSATPSKQALLDRCRSWLAEPIIEKNVHRIISLQVRPPTAEAVFTVRVVFDPHGAVYEYSKMMLFRIQAEFRKEGDDWQFSDVEVVEPADWRIMQSGIREGAG